MEDIQKVELTDWYDFSEIYCGIEELTKQVKRIADILEKQQY